MWDLVIATYFTLYAVLILILTRSWQKSYPQNSIPVPGEFISVVVPCRNEENNILSTLTDLENQTYPKDSFEVIVVNDHSDDKTRSEIEKNKSQFSMDLRCIDLTGESGKKAAITKGINQAVANTIVVTDADCRRKKEWLETLVSSHVLAKSDLSFGLVTFSDNSGFLSKLLGLEQASLIGSSVALWKLGAPVMGNGANMIFSKEKFQLVDAYEGNEHIPSGDDEFLLSKFRLSNFRIGYVTSREAAIETSPPKSFKELINQRIRWAGKWRSSKNAALKVIATLVFLMQLAFLLMFVPIILEKAGLAYFLLGILVKVILDLIFLKNISGRFAKRVRLWPFILLEIVYPFYILFFAGISNFKGYSWKGRSFPK